MAGLSSALGIAGIIFIIIGIIMAIVGIILLIANENQNKAWYVWFLLIGGVVIGIAGGIMLAIALSEVPTVMTAGTPYCGQPAMTYAPAPVVAAPVATAPAIPIFNPAAPAQANTSISHTPVGASFDADPVAGSAGRPTTVYRGPVQVDGEGVKNGTLVHQWNSTYVRDELPRPGQVVNAAPPGASYPAQQQMYVNQYGQQVNQYGQPVQTMRI